MYETGQRQRGVHVRQMSNPDSLPGRRITLARGSPVGSIIGIAVVVVIGILDGTATTS
jgi:hypothetical protein